MRGMKTTSPTWQKVGSHDRGGITPGGTGHKGHKLAWVPRDAGSPHATPALGKQPLGTGRRAQAKPRPHCRGGGEGSASHHPGVSGPTVTADGSCPASPLEERLRALPAARTAAPGTARPGSPCFVPPPRRVPGAAGHGAGGRDGGGGDRAGSGTGSIPSPAHRQLPRHREHPPANREPPRLLHTGSLLRAPAASRTPAHRGASPGHREPPTPLRTGSIPRAPGASPAPLLREHPPSTGSLPVPVPGRGRHLPS